MSKGFVDKNWYDLLPLVVATLKRGAKSLGEVKTEVRGSDYRGRGRTTERILGALEKAKLIEKTEDKRYVWLWDYEKYETNEEYEAKLNHSRTLINDAMGGDTLYIHSFVSNWNFKYILQHLDYDHRGFCRLWEVVNKDESQMEEDFWALYEEVKKIASKYDVNLRVFNAVDNPINVSRFNLGSKMESFREMLNAQVTYDIFNSFKKYLDFFIDDKEINGEVIESIANSISSDKHMIKKLRELASINSRILSNYGQLYTEVRLIIAELVHGEPLRGTCDLCAKVKIGKKDETREVKDK